MKKTYLLLLLIASVCFAGCSNDDDKVEEQGYTSFTIMQNEIETQANTIVGYYRDGLCHKLVEIGDLKKGIPSNEFIIEDETISNIYVFSDYPFPSHKLDTTLILIKNKKSNFTLERYTRGITVDPKEPQQYPQ